MGSIFKRGTKLYLRIKGTDGQWKKLATGTADEKVARQLLADYEQKVAAVVTTRGECVTVKAYAEQWLAKRQTATVADDRSRLRTHAYPDLGGMAMTDVRPRHLRDLVMGLRHAGKLAPATIRQVSGLLHTLFKSAVIEEVIASNPVLFERGVLPKKADKDPTWRHEAIYTRSEIEALISDERILADRRMFYGLKALGAMRHSEAAALTWAQYDPAALPLGAINLGVTKSGVPRRMPAHPTLAAMLAEWKLTGWRELYGRAPGPADLIVPTRNLTPRDANESQRQLVADLELLEFRVRAGTSEIRKQNRRGHDMRRTFITLARTDGARADILRGTTHGLSASDMMNVYTTFDWATLCAEVVKLRIARREGTVIPLKMAAGGTPTLSVVPTVSQSPQPVVTTNENKRPRRDSNPCYLRERRVS